MKTAALPHPALNPASVRQNGIPCSRPRSSRASAALDAAAGSPRRISRWDFHKSGWAIEGPWPSSLPRRFAWSISSRARPDFAQLPHGHGEDGYYDGAGGVVEAFLRLPVVLRVAGLERPLAVGLRLEEIGGLVAGKARPRRATPASTTRPVSSASFRKLDSSSRADRNSPRRKARVH